MATITLRHTQKYNTLIEADLSQKDYWLVNVDIDRQFYNWLKLKYKDKFNFFENFEKLNHGNKIYVEGIYYKEL